jgi:acyl-CoA synthetase (NDP forming)
LYSFLSGNERERIAIANYLSGAEIPVYPSLDRAAKAVANISQYWRFRDEIEEN